MNEKEGTTTSSPGPTPQATSARCSAVVHELSATPWPAPTRAANSRSNRATRGPCATQPESTASRAASASRSSRYGIITGMRSGPGAGSGMEPGADSDSDSDAVGA
jgi:hypothetical protein